jgi:DNA-binding GntR family transcriptional regulator
MIREEILRGGLRLGSAISRRRLARNLGMSVLPVSEAIQRLENEGLLETRARAGTRVRIPSLEDVHNSYIVREALESQSARLFAERATPPERRELQELGEQTDELFRRWVAEESGRGLLSELRASHYRFHMRIAECGRCPVLCDAVEQKQMLVCNWLLDFGPRRQPRPLPSHRELSHVLVTGPPEAADGAMREHIRYGLDYITPLLEAQAARNWREQRRPPQELAAAET